MAHQWRPTFIISAVSLVLLVGTDAALPQRAPGECLNGISQGSFSAFPSPFQVIGSGSPVVTNLSTTVTFATGFQVAYFPTYKLVTNKVAYEGPFTYALVQCGLEPPSEAQLPANTKIFTIPLTSVAVEDTTNEAMMVALGLQARVSYVSQYAVDPCFQSLGLGGCMALTSGDANNKTDVNVANVDGIFGYQDSSKTIAVSATSDPGPLNRAEWIKFVATFFNKEDMANAFFNGVTQRYNTVKSAVAAQNVARKPVVAWIIWMPAGDYNPEQVQISFAQYKATFTQDAGGQMLDLAQANATARKYSSDVKYSFNSLILGYNLTTLAPQLREILADVDVLIEESKFPSTANADVTLQTVMDVYGFTAADQQNLKFLRNNKVLREDAQSNPQDFTTWFGKAVINPDVVLEEMARVITPAAVTSNASPQYLRLLGQQPSTLLKSSQCPLQNCLLSSAPSISNAPICPLVHRACDGSIVSATPEQRCAPTCASPPPPQAASMTTPLLSTLGIACILALVMALAM